MHFDNFNHRGKFTYNNKKNKRGVKCYVLVAARDKRTVFGLKFLILDSLAILGYFNWRQARADK